MSNYGLHFVRFVGLILLQVLILNNMLFLDFLKPYVYPLFIILLPLNINKIQALFLAFFMGLSIDFFENTGGVHAAACLVIAYIRPLVLRFSFGINYDYQTLKFYNESFNQRFTYLAIMVFTHHLIMFSLEAFSITHLIYILKSTFFSGAFSLCLMLLFIQLIRNKK